MSEKKPFFLWCSHCRPNDFPSSQQWGEPYSNWLSAHGSEPVEVIRGDGWGIIHNSMSWVNTQAREVGSRWQKSLTCRRAPPVLNNEPTCYSMHHQLRQLFTFEDELIYWHWNIPSIWLQACILYHSYAVEIADNCMLASVDISASQHILVWRTIRTVTPLHSVDKISSFFLMF